MKKAKFLHQNDPAVYNIFSFKDVWDFINPNDKNIYEVRIKAQEGNSIDYIKKLARQIKVPWHYSGVFIQTLAQYEACCKFGVQNKLTMYLSVNPKRKSYHGTKNNEFPTYNGKKQSELGIYFILLDFDPTDELKKKHPSTYTIICYQRAKYFLSNNQHIKKYMIVCSGNGIQIRIPLDEPIIYPPVDHDTEFQPIFTNEHDAMYRMVKEAMCISAKKYSDDKILVDQTSFEVSRVGRLPFSINWKLDKKLYAGPIEICDEEENIGLTDYLLKFKEKLETQETVTKKYTDADLAKEFTLGPTSLKYSKLVKFMTKQQLPGGGRNNILFYQFKLLCLNNKIDLNSKEVLDIVRVMERVQNEHYPLNDPGKGTFHPEAIINYCLTHKLPPIYDVLYFRKKYKNLEDSWFNTETRINTNEKLEMGKTIVWDLVNYFKQNPPRFRNITLLQQDIINILSIIDNSYGKDMTEYLLKYNILKTVMEKIYE